MLWRRKLSEPIVLDDGRAFTMLRNAADYALALPKRRKGDPAWQYAIRLLMKAAEPQSTIADLAEAERQLHACLKADGLLSMKRLYEPSRPRRRRR